MGTSNDGRRLSDKTRRNRSGDNCGYCVIAWISGTSSYAYDVVRRYKRLIFARVATREIEVLVLRHDAVT